MEIKINIRGVSFPVESGMDVYILDELDASDDVGLPDDDFFKLFYKAKEAWLKDSEPTPMSDLCYWMTRHYKKILAEDKPARLMLADFYQWRNEGHD